MLGPGAPVSSPAARTAAKTAAGPPAGCPRQGTDPLLAQRDGEVVDLL